MEGVPHPPYSEGIIMRYVADVVDTVCTHLKARSHIIRRTPNAIISLSISLLCASGECLLIWPREGTQGHLLETLYREP